MKADRRRTAAAPRKVPTGISGFDEITGGGLPRGRTGLVFVETIVNSAGAAPRSTARPQRPASKAINEFSVRS